MTPPPLRPDPIASSSRLQPPPSPRLPLLPETQMSSPTFVKPTHPGCVLCGLVASAAGQSRTSFSQSDDGLGSTGDNTPVAASPTMSPVVSERQSSSAFLRTSYPTPGPSTRAGPSLGQTVKIGEREIVYRDQDITVFPAIGKERLCSDGRHLIIVMNQHVESVYNLGPSDIPVLSHMLDTARQFLSNLPSSTGDRESAKQPDLRVGFIGPIMRDPKCPHAHLHAHAMLGPVDTSLPGAGLWRRNVVFGSLNWWSIEDLRAEIRQVGLDYKALPEELCSSCSESTSNNRVKSGYEDRIKTPLDRVPDAGSVSGPANVLDIDQYADTSRPVTPVPTSVPMGAGPSPLSKSTTDSDATPTALDRGKGRAVDEEDYEAVVLGGRVQ